MIVVTGGSGKAGRACISELADHGYDLCNVDLVSGSDPSIPFSQVDLTDFGQTMAALSGIDERVQKVTGIVHLAAIPLLGVHLITSLSRQTRLALTTSSKPPDSSKSKTLFGPRARPS